MTLGQNGVLRYGHFGEFLEFFGIEWPIWVKVHVNTGQNKFEVNICIHWSKWPPISTK